MKNNKEGNSNGIIEEDWQLYCGDVLWFAQVHITFYFIQVILCLWPICFKYWYTKWTNIWTKTYIEEGLLRPSDRSRPRQHLIPCASSI